MTRNQQTETPVFEVKSCDENLAVFKRVIREKGRKPSQIRRIEGSLPTATIHFFDPDDFARLKEIEFQLQSAYAKAPSRRKSWLKVIYDFFEVD